MESRFYCRSCGHEQAEGEAENADFTCPQCGEVMVPKDPEAKAGKKTGLKIMVFVVLVILAIAAGLFLSQKKEYSSPDIPFPDNAGGAKIVNSLLESARALNSKTPLMVDNSTQLNKVVVAGNTITYKNTLVNLTAEDRARDDVFKKNVKQFLMEKYCSNEKAREGMKAGVVYGHEYSDRDGTLLFSATVSYADCAK